MALRLLEIIVSKEGAERAVQLLKESDVSDVWREDLSEGYALIRLLLPADQTEAISDRISGRFSDTPGFRLLSFAIEATVPPLDEPEDEVTSDEGAKPEKGKVRFERISREELYADVVEGAQLSTIYIVTTILSTLVAAIGLKRGDVAVIIGAMVIAPLLGPNVALALAATLGDLSLALRSFKTSAVGFTTALLLSLFLGFTFGVDADVPEIASRTELTVGDIVLALAAGSAGALAFTTGVPAALIGVMVAVALLPPLATCGLLAGAGHGRLALNAFLLVLTNVTCVNLAGVVTFLVQGIRPRNWWEAEKAKRASRIAVGFWLLLLVILLIIILLSWHR